MSLLRKPPAGWVWWPISVNLAFGMKKQEHSEFKARPPPQKKNKIKSHLLNISDHFFLFIHLLIYFACVRWRRVAYIMGRKLRGRTVNSSSLKTPLLVEYSTVWLGLPDCGKPNYLELSLVLRSHVSPTSVPDTLFFWLSHKISGMY